MKSTSFFHFFDEKISQTDQKKLFESFRLDSIIWDAFIELPSIQKIVDTIGTDVESWNLGEISLIHFGLSSQILARPISEKLYLKQAVSLFESIRSGSSKVQDLKQATLLALALYERGLKTNDWRGILSELGLQRFESRSTFYHCWRTPLAILYSFLDNSTEFLQAIAADKDENIAISLINHIISVQLMEKNEKANIIKSLVEKSTTAKQITWYQSFPTQLGFMVAELSKVLRQPDQYQFETDKNIFSSFKAIEEKIQEHVLSGYKNILEKSNHQANAHFKAAKEITGRLENFIDLLFIQSDESFGGIESNDFISVDGQIEYVSLKNGKANNNLEKNLLLSPHVIIQKLISSIALKEKGEENRAKELGLRDFQLWLQDRKNNWPAIDEIELLQKIDHKKLIDSLKRLELPDQIEAYLLFLDSISKNDPLISKIIVDNIDQYTNAESQYEKYKVNSVIEPENIQIQKKLMKLLVQKKDWGTLYSEWQAAERKGNLDQNDWFEYANAACNAGKISEAKALCEQLASQGMEEALVHSIKGKIQFLEGETDLAKISLQEALKGNAENAEAWLTVAEIHEQQGDFNEAIATLRSAVLAVPESDEIHYALARICLHQNLFAEALPYLRKAIALNGEDENYFVDLIITLKELGHLDESQKYLFKARLKWCDHPELAFLDAQRCLESDNREQALAAYATAISNDEKAKPEWLLQYAKALLNDSENQFSLTEKNAISMEYLLTAQKVLQGYLHRKGEKKSYAHILLAEVLYLLNEFPAAHSIYLDLVDSSQNREFDLFDWSWRIAAGLGMVKIALDEIEMGLVMLKDAVSRNSTHIGIKHVLAEAYLLAALNDEAAQTAMESYNLCATDVRNLTWYAAFMKKLAKNDEVIKALENANLLSNENPELAIQLASEYVIVGNVQAANSTLESLLKQPITEYPILRKLTTTFLRLGNLENAYKSYKKGLLTLTPLTLENQLEFIYLGLSTGKWHESLDQIQRLISQNYTFTATFAMQAEVLMGLGQFSSALNAFDQSLLSKKKLSEYLRIKNNNDFFVPMAWIQMMEESELTLTKLARCAIKANEFEKSMRSINQVIQLQPTVSAYKLFAADISLQLNDYETAFNYLSYLDNESMKNNDEVFVPIKQAFDYLMDRFQGTNLPKLNVEIQFENPLSDCLAVLNMIAESDFQSARTAFLVFYDQLKDASYSFGSDNVNVLLSQTWGNLAYRLAILCALDLYEFKIASALVDEWSKFTGCEIESSFFNLLILSSTRNFADLFSTLKIKTHRVLQLEKQGRDEQLITQLHKKMSQQSETELIKNFIKLVELNKSNDTTEIISQIVNTETILSVKYILIDRLMVLGKESDVDEIVLSSKLQADDLLTIAKHQLVDAPHKVINLLAEVETNSNPLINMALAYCFRQLNNFENALEYNNRALQTWSDEESWKIEKARLLDCMGESEKAMTEWEKIIQEAPSIKEVIFPYLETLLNNGRSIDVLRTLESYKKDISATFDYYLYQSRAFLLEGNLDAALSAVQTARGFDGENELAILHEGNVFLVMKQYEKAKQNAYQVIQKVPENIDGQLLMISILEKQNKFQEAIRMAEKALIASPENHQLLMSMAWNSREIGKLVEALHIVSNMSVQNSEDWESHSLLALIYNDLEDFQAAEENAKKSLRVNMEQPGILMLLGGLLRQQGHLDQALEYYSKAAAINKEDVVSCLQIGDIYFDQQNYPSALDAYQEAIIRDSNDARPYFKTGQIMKEVKDYQGAEKMLRMAAKLSPKDTNIRRQLAGVIALNFVHSPLEAK